MELENKEDDDFSLMNIEINNEAENEEYKECINISSVFKSKIIFIN